jgi:hypothetical protein
VQLLINNKIIKMKILKLTPVYLLALIYLVFGSNFFLQFLKMPAMSGDAGTFIGVIYKTEFLRLVKTLEIVLAILLIVKPTRALALLLIAPISLNIFLFEVLVANQPGIGILLVLLNAFSIYQLKEKYIGIVR